MTSSSHGSSETALLMSTKKWSGMRCHSMASTPLHMHGRLRISPRSLQY